MMAPKEPRLSSGVEGLDAMLGGGFLPGSSVLLAGAPGTGKTTLGLHFLAAGVAAGEKGVFVTFEYLPQQLYHDALQHGWDVKSWEEKGLVRVICTTPDVLLAETGPGRTILDDAMASLGASRLVIDSMSHFEFLRRPAEQLRQDLSGLMNHLRLLDVTTVVTHEIPEIVGPAVKISQYGLEFLVDAVIVLRYVELEGELQKAINVLKFRGSDHDRHYRRLRLGTKGVSVESTFTGIENISSGTAHRSLQTRARELV
jgi:circadian clock protein KaiC